MMLMRFGEDWINPEHVVYVKRIDTGTRIWMLGGSVVDSAWTVDQVLGMLQGQTPNTEAGA